MKKIVSCLLLLALSASTALAIGQRSAKIPLLDDTVERTVAQATAQPWKTQLKRFQARFFCTPLHSNWALQAPARMKTSLTYKDEQIYLQRMIHLQKQVRQQEALKEFTFVAPVPADLAHLSPAIYQTLTAFLQDKQTVRVNTYTASPFTLAVQIHGLNNSALELWMDVGSKKVYLMTDNYFSTAQAKYGLHLK